MLTIILKNETDKSYDSIRRAMKAAYKDSAAYRMRQVEFDDSLKSENTLQMKIGDYKALNLQLSCTITDVKQISMVMSDLMDDPKPKGKGKYANADESAKTEDNDKEPLYADDEVIAEAAPDTGVGEGAIIQTSEQA